MSRNRYALLTVDTEALPRRASQDHIKRLMWGQHENGRAGVGEMVAIGNEFGAKHVFFIDLCGAYSYLDEIKEVIRWLDEAGQDVQLHTHPEYLPASFWDEHSLARHPRYMNQYAEDSRAAFVIQHFAALISQETKKPVLAHRAGSFRWNASTIRALKVTNIPLSFNNSMCAVYAGQCVYSEPTNLPFLWSNGVIEVPMTEKKILPKVGKPEWWARLTHPESPYFQFHPWWGKLLFDVFSGSPTLSVFLLHSWSLLYWDEQGHAAYRDNQRLEGYRKLLARLVKDYDVITTAEFLDLHAQGKITTTHTVDLAHAELKLLQGKRA
ncbi:polysaccharide deacetylase [Nitrosomonas sp. HPC101]|uniref:polysaccharide deacetylase n=1 Tax=Nitrosomonas sp. HPC101 TaxID=1658667 RepID=UPI001367BCBC|nr:polysaccharide deacetylase [Nitrosomonas sp. HPC101]MXS86207.1 polysaccharide deacetylase [Nitrosomonas sp. HPC101]